MQQIIHDKSEETFINENTENGELVAVDSVDFEAKRNSFGIDVDLEVDDPGAKQNVKKSAMIEVDDDIDQR